MSQLLSSLQSAEKHRHESRSSSDEAWDFASDSQGSQPQKSQPSPVAAATSREPTVNSLFQEDAEEGEQQSGIGSTVRPLPTAPAPPSPATTAATEGIAPLKNLSAQLTASSDRPMAWLPGGDARQMPIAAAIRPPPVDRTGSPGRHRQPEDEERFQETIRLLMPVKGDARAARHYSPAAMGGGVLLLVGVAAAGYLLHDYVDTAEEGVNTGIPTEPRSQPPLSPPAATLHHKPVQPTVERPAAAAPVVQPISPATAAATETLVAALPAAPPAPPPAVVVAPSVPAVVPAAPVVAVPPPTALPAAAPAVAVLLPSASAMAAPASPAAAQPPPSQPSSPQPLPGEAEKPPAPPLAAQRQERPAEPGAEPGEGFAAKAVASPPPSRRAAPQSPAKGLLDKAYRAFRFGSLEEAAGLFHKALKVDPHNHQAMIGVASVNMRRANMEEARFWYRRVLREDPNNTLALTALLGLEGTGDVAEAESRLKNLLHDHPEASHLHFALGNVYAAQGRWSLAYGAYADAHHLGQERNPEVLLNLAASLDHLQRWSEALLYYNMALAIAETDLELHVHFDVEAVRQRIRSLYAISGQPQ
ncbi:MAG: tetratricopeptide repeat protein [Magnetococcales bacterium]|nr:tetratricopeptide repeat protein [Magnetococcales bacterium]